MFKDVSFLIGSLSKTHGVKGEILLYFKSESAFNYIELESVFLEIEGKLVPFFIESIREKNDESFLVKFRDIDSDAKAQRFLKCNVYVHLDDKAESSEDEFDMDALVGFKLLDEEDNEIGEITGIVEYPNNILFSVDAAGAEILIPASDDLIIEFDPENRILVMQLPDGLIGLN